MLRPLLDEGVAPEVARAVTEALMKEVLGESAKAKKAKEQEAEAAPLQTGQITVLGRPEVDFLLVEARAVCSEITTAKEAGAAVKARLGKDGRKNLQALKHGAGLDAALFGRMVTSDILTRGDAALHVAHAFTVHSEAAESDYFSVVDDLLRESEEEQLGSGHIGTTELTSGLYYGYVVVDVPLLVSNLEGCAQRDWLSADRSLAAEVVGRFVHLIATVSPGAKKGSTAPYAYAHLLIAEAGDSQPRTFANAFLKPVRETPDVAANTYRALQDHIGDLDEMFGVRTTRRAMAAKSAEELCAAIGAERTPLGALATWCSEQVRN